MGSAVLYMSVSLDGFVTGPNVSVENGLGDGGERLHDWVFPVEDLTGVNRQVYDEFMSTGAVVAGRGTFEPARGWDGDHHDGVPVYVLSRGPAPAWAAGWPNVHYSDDLATILAAAKEAAGERDVLVHGCGIARRAVPAGLLDEVQVHLVPVLLGAGRTLFDGLRCELERVGVREGEEGVTHLRYRVVR